ncbi:hypothetical protein BB561_006927, partial [Smittium simulii]
TSSSLSSTKNIVGVISTLGLVQTASSIYMHERTIATDLKKHSMLLEKDQKNCDLVKESIEMKNALNENKTLNVNDGYETNNDSNKSSDNNNNPSIKPFD